MTERRNGKALGRGQDLAQLVLDYKKSIANKSHCEADDKRFLSHSQMQCDLHGDAGTATSPW